MISPKDAHEDAVDLAFHALHTRVVDAVSAPPATEIVARGHAPEVVNKVWRMLHLAEYKRRQAPPGPKITPRLFNRERRYPITNGFGDIV